MISRQLPRITLQQHVAIDEVAQALALTYLAYYNTEPMQPRVLEAYKRAWAFDTLTQFPRKLSGTPGFNVALWSGEGIKHMHVAIEGTTNLTQLLPHAGISAWTSGTWLGLIAGVVTTHYGYAIDILSQLQADTVLGPKLTDQRWVITFTGHSLGAACADVLALRVKVLSPIQRVRLIKFGSPRVGNRAYLNWRERLVPTKSVYCSKDPIHLFPSSGTGGVIGRALFGPIVPSDPVIEEVPYLMRRDRATWFAGQNSEVNGYPIAYVRSLASGFAPRSSWYDHLIKSYRLAMLNLVSAQRDMLQYRFRYLEHNDENRWQEGFGPGNDVWAPLDALGLGVVEDATPISGEVEQQTDQPAPVQAAIVNGAAPLDDPLESAMWAPVGYAATPPAQVQRLPRRRFTRSRPI